LKGLAPLLYTFIVLKSSKGVTVKEMISVMDAFDAMREAVIGEGGQALHRRFKVNIN